MDVRFRAFRIFVQDGGEGSALRLCHFTATFIDQTRGQVVTSSSNRRVTTQYFVLVFPKLQPLVAAFELRSVQIFLKINLDQTVAVYSNNSDCKWGKMYLYLLVLLL